MMKDVTKYTILLVLGIVISCGNSDDVQPVGGLEVGYSQNVYQIPFYSKGTSVAPNIEWNGDIGLFSLQKAVPGVSIDFKTGVLSWDGTLPIGENEITVIAVNAAREVQTAVFPSHSFGGNFQGEVDFPNYDPIVLIGLIFNTNGSGTVSVGDYDSPSDQGFWTLVGNTISGQYAWSDDPGPYFIEGVLTTTETGAYIEGRYDEGPVDDGSGVFRVDFVPK